MQGRQRQCWAFLANPKTYNIEKAVQEQEEDSWDVQEGMCELAVKPLSGKRKEKIRREASLLGPKF
jgi:hypothetical protein